MDFNFQFNFDTPVPATPPTKKNQSDPFDFSFPTGIGSNANSTSSNDPFNFNFNSTTNSTTSNDPFNFSFAPPPATKPAASPFDFDIPTPSFNSTTPISGNNNDFGFNSQPTQKPADPFDFQTFNFDTTPSSTHSPQIAPTQDFNVTTLTPNSAKKPDAYDFNFNSAPSPEPVPAKDPFDFSFNSNPTPAPLEPAPSQPKDTFDFNYNSTPAPTPAKDPFDFSFSNVAPSPSTPSAAAKDPFDFSLNSQPSPTPKPADPFNFSFNTAPPQPQTPNPMDNFNFTNNATTTQTNAFDFSFNNTTTTTTTTSAFSANVFDFNLPAGGQDSPKPPKSDFTFDFETPTFDGGSFVKKDTSSNHSSNSFDIPPLDFDAQHSSATSTPIQKRLVFGSTTSAARPGSAALPQLVDFTKMNVSTRPTKSALRPVSSVATPQQSFDEDPSLFYLSDSWLDQPFQERSNKLNFKTSGAGASLSVNVKAFDGTEMQISVTDGITGQDLLFAAADRLKMWQAEFFTLLNVENDTWIHHKKLLSEQMIRNGSTFLMKIRYWKFPSGDSHDGVAERLIYHQVKENILNSVWPVSVSLAVRLAAYQLKHEVGNYNPEVHRPGFLKNRFNLFLPATVMRDTDLDYLERRVLYVHSQITLISQDDIITNYITISQALQTFGLTMFRISRNNIQQSLGIGEDGLLVNRDPPASLDHFDFIIYPLLKDFEKTSDGLIINCRNDKSYNFQADAKEVDEMIELMCGYFQLLQGIDRGLLPDIVLPMRAQNTAPAHYFAPPQSTSCRPVRASLASRLQLLKIAYKDCAEKANVNMFETMQFQIDQALDLGIALERLDLSSTNITSKDFLVLKDTFEIAQNLKLPPSQAPFFEENLNIVQFILDDNVIGSEAAEALGNLLAISRFKEIHLNRVKLGTKGALLLRPFLDKNTSTEKWMAESNKLGDKGMKACIHGLKRSVELNTFNFSDNGLNEISTLLLRSLLEKNSAISELNLSYNKLGDGGLGTLLTGLKANKGLRNIDLCRTGITGKTVVPFLTWMSETAQLREVDLSENNLGDAVGKELVKVVATPNGLVSLKFKDAKIGTKILEDICEALASNKSIRCIHLNGNQFEKKRGAVSLLAALRANNTLRSVGFGNTSAGKGPLIELSTLLKEGHTLKSIDLSDTPEFKSMEVLGPFCEALGEVTCKLEELVLQKCGLTSEGITALVASLHTNKYLKKLDLSKNKFGKTGLTALANALHTNITLQVMTLRGSDVTPTMFADFFTTLDGKNITLRRIEIGDNGKSLKDWRTSLSNRNAHVQFFL